MRSDTVDLVNKLRDFDLDLHSIFGRINTVRGLNRQFSDPVQNILGFLQITFGGLNERYAVLYVPCSLIQAADLTAHFLTYRQSGRVVAGPVDPQSAGKFLHGLHCLPIDDTELPIRINGAHVVINNHVPSLKWDDWGILARKFPSITGWVYQETKRASPLFRPNPAETRNHYRRKNGNGTLARESFKEVLFKEQTRNTL
jgi:hypothetical protein